jgi:hypothetical protein
MGRYKNGKPNAEIDLDDLRRGIEQGHFTNERHKSYLVLLYWLGCRRGEPLCYVVNHQVKYPGVRREDIELEADSLALKIPAFKNGKRAEKVHLPLELYGVGLIREAWEKTGKGKLIWNFSPPTGYNIIKRIWPNKSPHWLRHNRVTKIRRNIDGKTFSLDDAKSFTGIRSDRTMQNYGMTTVEGADRVSKALT